MSDLKRVENICYKFIWQGKDRIKRSYLKNEPCNGGLKSIDIECYTLALKIRNFIKAYTHCKELRIIQESYNPTDDITLVVRNALYKLHKNTLKAYDDSEVDRNTALELASTNLRYFVKPNSKADYLLFNYSITCMVDLNSTNIPRGKKNIILKSIPNCVKLYDRIIDNSQVRNEVNQFLLFYKKKEY